MSTNELTLVFKSEDQRAYWINGVLAEGSWFGLSCTGVDDCSEDLDAHDRLEVFIDV